MKTKITNIKAIIAGNHNETLIRDDVSPKAVSERLGCNNLDQQV